MKLFLQLRIVLPGAEKKAPFEETKVFGSGLD